MAEWDGGAPSGGGGAEWSRDPGPAAPSGVGGGLGDVARGVVASPQVQGAWNWFTGKALPKAGELASNVFNADTRASEAALAGKNPWEGVMHPDTWDANRAAAERNLHIPQTGNKLGQAAIDTAFDVGVSPSTYVGGIVGKGLVKAGGKAIEGLWRAPVIGEKLAEAFRPNNLVRRALSAKDAAKYEGIVASERLAADKAGLAPTIREANIAHRAAREGLPYIQQLARGDKNKAARAVSEMGKEAMFVNPLPHMGNIGELTRLHSGEATVARGLQLMAKPDAALTAEAEHFGALSHMLREPKTLIAKGKYNPFGHVLKASNKALDNFETGMRTAVYEKALKEASKGGKALSDMDRYWAAALARRVADYANTNGFTRFLADKLGAPFPQWHVLAMPASAISSAVRNPQRAGRFLAAGHNINVMNPDENLSSGKPTENMLGAVANPMSYFGGMSAAGPVGSLGVDAIRAMEYNESTRKFGAEQAQKIFDWLTPPGVGMALGLNPFNAPGGIGEREALGAVGAYTAKKPVPPAGAVGAEWAK